VAWHYNKNLGRYGWLASWADGWEYHGFQLCADLVLKYFSTVTVAETETNR
jgi:hypothetical protein